MRQCIVCKCDIDHIHPPAVRCITCQRQYRLWYWKQKRRLRMLTKLGGKPITLDEIRNYNKKPLPDRCFRKCNEVNDENNY